ncbi:unnamed protein product [Cuscuta epithymum]|uniref:Cytochrome P450 CYP82D47-like n=1 Tax=Cuscuta epithymum TaxID=186058 RepID=A0AAV0GH09_9ASTE|nr:unnamed protein product [Cuscuta epithymum]
MEFVARDLITYSIFAVAIGCFYIVFHYVGQRSNNSGKQRSPPEAGGGRPVFGHLHLFRGAVPAHVALGELADKYGPAFTIRIGMKKVLVVSDREWAQEIFTSHDLSVSERPRFRAAKHLGYDYKMFGFSPYGPYWRDIRKLTSTQLLSHRRLDQLKHVRDSEIETAVKELYDLWREKNPAAGGGDRVPVLVEMKKWFGDVSMNVFLRMIAGKRCFGRAAERSDDDDGRRCQRVLRDFFHYLGVAVPADALPILGWLDLGGYEKAMKGVAKEMDLIVDQWLREHRRRLKEEGTGGGGGEKDLMDVMLRSGYDSDDTAIKSTCMVLLSGGADTTMVMLTWAMSLIMNNPHVLKTAQEELDKVVGKERRVNESDINSLVYLQAIVKETLRLYPGGPLGGPRLFREDCTIQGLHVPKGTWLYINVWKLQRDPHVWFDPDEFKPERFVLNNSHKWNNDFELFAFGAGRKVCPGITVGLLMLHLVLANLLHFFDLSTDAPIDMSESFGLTNLKATPLEILISPRLSSSLY